MSPIHPSTRFINEYGLYILLTNSKKKLAVNFRNELFSNIIPQIRKTGTYSINKNKQNKLNKLNKLNNRLHQLEESNKNLKNNQKNIIYPIGSALYI